MMIYQGFPVHKLDLAGMTDKDTDRIFGHLVAFGRMLLACNGVCGMFCQHERLAWYLCWQPLGFRVSGASGIQGVGSLLDLGCWEPLGFRVLGACWIF